MITPRYRTSGNLQRTGQIQSWSRWNTCAQSAWTLLGTYAGPYLGTKKLMYDYVVTGFRGRVKKGEVFFNPLLSETRTVSSGGGQGSEIKAKNYIRVPCNQYYGYKVTGDYFAMKISSNSSSGVPPFQLIVEEDVDSLKQELSTCVLAKRGSSDSNLWESMAELQKSAMLLKSLGSRAVKLTGVLGASMQAGQASKEWLAYRYGIKPIIRDVENVLATMRKTLGRVRRTSRCSGNLYQERTDYGSYDHDSVRDTYYILRKDSVSVRAMSLDEFEATLLGDAGLSSKGLWMMPWELLPYSFVADWFFNVGEFIGAVVPTFGFKQLGSCVVVEREVSANYVCTGTVEQDGTFAVVSPTTGSVTSVVTSKQRGALLSPGLFIKRDFRFDTLTRAADAFALVGSMLLGKGPTKPLKSIQF